MNSLHYCFLLFNSIVTMSSCFNWKSIDLPEEHLPYFFSSFKTLGKECQVDERCPFKRFLGFDVCWGYEANCNTESRYFITPKCPGDHRGWVKTKEAQADTFYNQADFGYVKEQLQEMTLLCEPTVMIDSSLECSQYLRFCRGRNLMLNFTSLNERGDNLRYKMDILGPGQIGGYCKLNKKRLLEEATHISPLQSWGPEMQHFVELNELPTNKMCDIIVDKPTYIMKLDATVNMYHHFCDFFNLYVSLHVNSTHPVTFMKDTHILIWETFTYMSAFGETWKAFSKNPVWDLKQVRGKVVCFKNVVFPLLPRMIFGLFYNTPLIQGCERSGLFHAFSAHILHSLGVKKDARRNDRVRITLLSRGTSYRRILNEQTLLDALKTNKKYEVNRAVFDRSVPFVEQLKVIHNTDVLIGMHGAGLTHLLFLPDWATVFELYNCEDPACYSDLSRLRGLNYITWEDKSKLVQEDEGHHPEGGSHAKFTNYSFDKKEFVRLVKKAVRRVREHADFKRFISSSGKPREEL